MSLFDQSAMSNVTPHRPRRMLVFCPFPQGVAAGQRLKYEQYFDDWRSHGWSIDVSPFMDMETWRIAYQPGRLAGKMAGVLRGHVRRLRDLARVRNYDAVYVFMWVTPFGTSIMERAVRRFAQHLIYDLEDNVVVGPSLPKEYNPNVLLSLLKGPQKARFLIREADHVVASSAFLRDFCLQELGARACSYISSSVDTNRFVPRQRLRKNDKIIIGWTGTFSTRLYLDTLRGVFQELAQNVDYKLRIIGNFDYELPGVELEVIQWSNEREVEDLQGIDIGVYPLPKDEWVRGKSGLKAIQYMAFGVPTVATDAGMTPLIIRHEENGLLVGSDAEWIEALKRLVLDGDLRERLGRQAREDAVKKFSLDPIGVEYRRVLDQVSTRN